MMMLSHVMRFASASVLAMMLGALTVSPAGAESIAVGSKKFTESRLLAEVMAQLIEAQTELDVERKVNLGGTLIAHEAIISGEIDLYPEYTGTAWAVVLKFEGAPGDALRTYLQVSSGYRERFGLRWLDPLGFNNSYAVTVLEETAERLDLHRISDLAARGSELRVAWSHEFLNREDGYPALRDAYGLEMADVRGMEHGLAYEAIRTGRIDVTDAYTTDGKLLRFPVRMLEDDRRFFPPYQAAPVIRQDTLERHPELAAVLAQLAFTLSDHRMQRLNYEVEEEGRAFEDVARAFLVEEGLLGERSTGDGPSGAEPVTRKDGFVPFMIDRLPTTLELTVQHLWLTGVAMLLAILFAVPLGVLLTRLPPLSGPVLGVAGVLQTVPSLALLAFMIPIPGLGLGVRSAIAALFLYALLPILRNTYTGIRDVDPDVVEAAVGLGLTRGQVLRLVELPLAFRTIMAGIRTAAVISIGVATLAAFIGAGGLGDPIVTGLQLNDTSLILSGALPAALLAILVDWLLGLVETRLGVD